MDNLKGSSVALVGMSGCGKSYWSKKLADYSGYKLYVIDELIEDSLKKQIIADGYEDIALWMGKPTSKSFKERQKQYFQLESHYVTKISNELDTNPSIIDTTGSFIHLNQSVMDSLLTKVKTIHLQTPLNSYEEMYNEFLSNPKPIVWGDIYNQDLSLKENYINLLNFRKEKYLQISNCSIPYNVHRGKDFNASKLLEYIKD